MYVLQITSIQSRTIRRTHWGNSKCKALGELSLATRFSISWVFHGLLVAVNSPIRACFHYTLGRSGLEGSKRFSLQGRQTWISNWTSRPPGEMSLVCRPGWLDRPWTPNFSKITSTPNLNSTLQACRPACNEKLEPLLDLQAPSSPPSRPWTSRRVMETAPYIN